MKKILVNCLHCSSSYSGANTRIFNLYSLLSKKKKYKIFFLINNNFKLKLSNHKIKFIKTSYKTNNFLLRYFYTKKILKKLKKKHSFDFYDHSFLPFVSYNHKSTCSFYTIHDLRYLIKNINKNFFTFFLFKYLIKKAFRDSTKVITVSNFIKNEIKKIFNFRKVLVIPNFTDPEFIFTKVKKKNKNRFIFTLGHLEKRKNIFFLLKAFSTLVNNKIYNGKLVFATPNYSANKYITKIIKYYKIEKKVRLEMNVTKNKIIELLDQSDCFIFPSIYEGFGIPILEALSRNSRILLSDIPPFREITFNKFLYFQPNNVEDFLVKFSKVMKSENINYITKKILKKYSYKRICNLFEKKVLNDNL
jgi:hypothetical protein